MCLKYSGSVSVEKSLHQSDGETQTCVLNSERQKPYVSHQRENNTHARARGCSRDTASPAHVNDSVTCCTQQQHIGLKPYAKQIVCYASCLLLLYSLLPELIGLLTPIRYKLFIHLNGLDFEANNRKKLQRKAK